MGRFKSNEKHETVIERCWSLPSECAFVCEKERRNWHGFGVPSARIEASRGYVTLRYCAHGEREREKDY